MFALGGSIWASGIGLISLTQNFFFDPIISYGGLVFVIGFFLMARAFPVPMQFNIPWYILYLPVFIHVFYTIPFGKINYGLTVIDGRIIPIAGPYLFSYALLSIGFTLFGFLILGYKLRLATGKTRLQIKYLFLGAGIFMLTSVISDSILPSFGIYNFIALGPLSSIVFTGLIAYAIARHELLDIRIIVQRGLIYTCLLIIIIGCYIGALNGAVFLIREISGNTLIIVGIITTIIGIFGVPVIDRYLKKATDKIFFKDKYDYAEAIHKLSAILNTSVEFDTLIERVESALKEILKCNSVKLKFNGETTNTSIISTDMKQLQVPVSIEEKNIGWIFCDEKRSGDPYTQEDVRLIETFAHQAAIALGRARLYKEVEDYAEMLESKVLERTEDLRLSQENQKQMIIDISHNLQTPLAVFQTKLEQLKKFSPNEPMFSDFERILGELSEFIYKLLSLANLEYAKERIISLIDLSSLVRDIEEEIKIIAVSHHIKVESEIEDNLLIKGNCKEIREAILNILSNAIKYMKPENMRKIQITLLKEGGDAKLAIGDNGIGIAPEDQSRIFERFYRVKKDGRTFGLGIGLAITKHIIKEHGGDITCTSKENVGTTFTIKLPLENRSNT